MTVTRSTNIVPRNTTHNYTTILTKNTTTAYINAFGTGKEGLV